MRSATMVTIVYGAALVVLLASNNRAIAQEASLPIAAARPAETPDPRSAGLNGDVYVGAGFTFHLPPNWAVDLDELGLGRHGERGTARGPVQNVDSAADATIRFEPFPVEPRNATLTQFEAHVRATLAAGVPIAVQPLVYHGSDPFIISDQPEGLAIHFTRPGSGGEPQRRYFVFAHPRADGRVQTLICSHLGPAIRGCSALFTHAGNTFATTRPDTGGAFRRDDLGLVLARPPGWRQVSFASCGTGLMASVPEQRRAFMHVASFQPSEAAQTQPLAAPWVQLELMQEADRPLESVVALYNIPADAWGDFAFADGARGRIADSASTILVFRQDGRRIAQARAMNVKPEDRRRVFSLLQGLQLVTPTEPDARTDDPKQLHAQGVRLTYPGDWRVVPLPPAAAGRLLSGTFEPIDGQGRAETYAPTRQLSPQLHLATDRLDDLRAEHGRLLNYRPADARLVKHSIDHGEQAFTTDSGWTGWVWTTTLTSDSRRGRSVHRTTTYILPLPSGVTALYLSGSNTTNSRNPHTAEPLERTWRAIAASARLDTPAAPSSRAGTVVQP